MQAQACFNQPGALLPLEAPERSFWRWASLAPVFSAPAAGAGARLPPQGPAAVQPCRVDEGGGRVLDVVGDDCVARGSGVGHGCSLGDELADPGLGHGAQDLLWIFS